MNTNGSTILEPAAKDLLEFKGITRDQHMRAIAAIAMFVKLADMSTYNEVSNELVFAMDAMRKRFTGSKLDKEFDDWTDLIRVQGGNVTEWAIEWTLNEMNQLLLETQSNG